MAVIELAGTQLCRQPLLPCHIAVVAAEKGFSTSRMLLPVNMGLVISTQLRGPVPEGNPWL